MAAHPELERTCQRCDTVWYAEKWTKTQANKPPLIAPGLTRRSQSRARQSIHEANMAAFDRFRRCPNCGSTAVKSTSGTLVSEWRAMRAKRSS